MAANRNGNRIEMFGDSKDIRKFLADLKKIHPNISKISVDYTMDSETGKSGLELLFKCRTEDGDIDVMYQEGSPSCASIEEAEEMRLSKTMTIRIPQSIVDKGDHQDIVDWANKWIADAGIDIALKVTNEEEAD